MLLTQNQAAYLAGLIDGEGSLECQKQMSAKSRTPRFVIRLSFTFVTAEPLATICKWLGVSMKEYPATDSRRSSRFRCHIPKSITVQVLQECLPFLLLKKRQAELILEIEKIRFTNTPSRHLGIIGEGRRMPLNAVSHMDTLLMDLRALKLNKRPGSPGWASAE